MAGGPGRTRAAEARVWALAALVGALAALLAWTALPHAAAPRTGWTVPWPVLAAGFAAAELAVVQLRVRAHSVSFSLVEVPLVVGLFLGTPGGTVLACVVGMAVVLGGVRRQPRLKLAVNLAHNALGAVVAVCLWSALSGGGGPGSPRAAAAAVLATVAFDLVCAVSTTTAIALRDRVRPSLPVAAAAESLTAVAGVSFGLVAVTVLEHAPSAGWALVVPSLLLAVGQRSRLALEQRHAELVRLQRFTGRVAAAPLDLDAVVPAVLTATRDLLDVEAVRLELPGRAWVADAAGVRDAAPPAAAAGPGGVRLPLRTDGRQVGAVLVTDAADRHLPLGARDRVLLDAMATHAAVALENALLADRLRVEAEAKAHQAQHDALTGLPNRQLFDERVAAALAGGRVAVLLFDLDRFKEVNDTLGHAAGDAVLREVGARLSARLDAACVARLGGDEFAVVLAGADLAEARAAAAHVRAVVDEPLHVEGTTLVVGTSVGIALSPQDGTDGPTLLRHADVAMYAAKEDPSGTALYDPVRDSTSTERLGLAADLRAALTRDELFLVYQPKVATTGRRVAGVEALVRWQHPERGVVPPDAFIPVAERTGLIGPLTEVVLRQALAQCRAWTDAGLDLPVAVNISPRTLHDEDFPAWLSARLEEAGVPAERLTLEITEGAIMADPGRAVRVLGELRADGVRLSVDDLGVGHSSLTYLRRLPVDEVKLDRSFVVDVVTDRDDRAIVAAVVDLVHRLGRSVVAEGVEDAATLAVLAELGADTAQGWWMSRPLPAGDVAGWVRGWTGPADVPAQRAVSPAASPRSAAAP